MKTKYSALLVRTIAALFLVSLPCYAQVKQRIAIYPFDDRTTANKDMNIGTKVADLLISRLASSSNYTVLDRQYVDRLLAEKNLKYDPNYDSAGAAKTGLLGTVDIVVAGQIDAFNSNTTQSTKGKLLNKVVETDGSVVLKVTARFISVERGSIITAPTVTVEKDGPLSKSTAFAPIVTNHIPGAKDMTDVNQQQGTDVQQALRKLVDEAAEESAAKLSEEVSKSAASLPSLPPIATVAAPVPAEAPTVTAEIKAAFIGISDGEAYIDKGSAGGIKAGDKFIIRRTSDTGLKDGSGHPILHHKPVCSLVIESVEESSASGKCVASPSAHGQDGIPRKGDEVISAAK